MVVKFLLSSSPKHLRGLSLNPPFLLILGGKAFLGPHFFGVPCPCLTYFGWVGVHQKPFLAFWLAYNFLRLGSLRGFEFFAAAFVALLRLILGVRGVLGPWVKFSCPIRAP